MTGREALLRSWAVFSEAQAEGFRVLRERREGRNQVAPGPSAIPPGAWPRGLGVEAAAAYCGVSSRHFLRLVKAGRLPAAVPAGWLGGAVFAAALALFAWAIATITRAGSNVPTNMPTTSIVDTGPYRFTRNPIYLGMVLGLVGLAIAFDSLWLLVTLVPFVLVIRYGVVAREEAYLERKFGEVYRRYRARVRRWL